MRINQLSYYDKKIEWRLEPIEFSKLNLLVGISGVGKTQILKSIMNLRKIARGHSLNGVMWDVNFSIGNNKYQWKGEFENNNKLLTLISDEEESDEKRFRITSEYLYLNGQLLIERTDAGINFKGNKLPKLSRFTSTINILNEEDDISPVKEGFNKLVYSDQSRGDYNSFNGMVYSVISMVDYERIANKYCSLKKIQESGLPTQIKLALTYKYEPKTFGQIQEQFINIFEHVEDIKIEPNKEDNLPKGIAEYPFVKIKEKSVDTWIQQNQISSGMLRTLMHISELYLSADDTVILIDEFENSLGINCIDILSDLLIENREIQFILTSHHPYVINKIGMEHWKIITRKGGVVRAKDIKDLNLPKSRHQAFMQLINLQDYTEGIAVG